MPSGPDPGHNGTSRTLGIAHGSGARRSRADDGVSTERTNQAKRPGPERVGQALWVAIPGGSEQKLDAPYGCERFPRPASRRLFPSSVIGGGLASQCGHEGPSEVQGSPPVLVRMADSCTRGDQLPDRF